MTSPHPPEDRPSTQGDGAEAIRRAEDALVKQHSAVAMTDLHVVSAVMSAHSTTAEGRRALAELQRQIETSVAERTDLDTPAGARDFQRYLIGRLRQIGSVVEAAGLDATSKAAMASAWTALYESATRNSEDPAPADTEPVGAEQPGEQKPEQTSGTERPGGAQPVPAEQSQPSAASQTDQPTGVSSSPVAPADQSASSDWPLEAGGYETWEPDGTSQATPATTTPASSVPAGSPASSVPFSLPTLTSSPASADPSAASPRLTDFGQDPYADLLAELEAPDDFDDLDGLDDLDEGEENPADSADEEPAGDADEPTRTVTLPDGDTVTAPTPQIAAALTAALSGTPVEDAFRQQGLTAAQPGVAPQHPLDPGKLSTGDIGVFTDRLAVALDDERAWHDGQIQPIATVSGPSFLGWQHVRADQPAAEAPQTPAPTRPAA
ncbi:DUF4226 domain-containing protein [Mycolicibacterium brumae]|uniref:DUF4226 domain-containing protein n=1 Tax=Mycolicibacterium brumae TaxID=85968 RepID=A0A2G5PDF7_9MYCO|nr:DUF4226 domain-containing protein [Mycolicibacterium brumae]MCV7191753.1 DUF4226 domain-containing protein [Mycolicibacterium brumae]PIB76358.1 DUF4226 domain-containing protein [Mycolicibacterium brumae]RWA15872.1 hypothetical protein MBRU_09995 [Mycolicibacterium brumae DSM 44177]UWW07059.1 DUF4226 domain-containing protein [Mycolicibacterium brumae]